MKIIYCTNTIHRVGGGERVLANKVNYLVKHGFDVSIVISSTNITPYYDLDPRVKIYSLDCDVSTHGLTGKLREYQTKKKYLKNMEALLLDLKPDVVVSMFDRYSRYIYKINDGSKKIVERHIGKYKHKQFLATWDKYTLGRVFTYLFCKYSEYAIYSSFDRFAVLTEEDKLLWGDMSNIIVMPNAFSYIPLHKSDVSSKRIVAAGRFVRQKRFNWLIEIWSKIAHKYPDWKLVIFGDGKTKKLDALVKKLGVEDFVELRPATKEIEKEFLNSSIYGMSSKYEGLPMVLLEAMSCGLPVVSYACKCGPRDIVNDGEDGFLINPGDMDSFAEKLGLLIENEEIRQRMGKAASENVLRFSEDVVMAKWIKLFNELASQS